MSTATSVRDHWGFVLRFHEKVAPEHPSGKDGLRAILRIREILGPDFEPAGPGRHPLKSKFYQASEPNYKWLIHFARKLDELLQIAGHEHVLARFGDSDTYPAALAEMEFALKIRLFGFPCKFAFQRGKPSPDLVAEVAGQQTDIEITSLNAPYEDVAGIEALSSVTQITLQAKCTSGGVWGRIPRPGEMEEVKTKAQKAVEEANSDHKLVELNVPGLLSCYIAPNDIAAEIPAMWRGSFVMRTRSALPKRDRLARKIEEKAKSQLSSTKPGILAIYDRLSSPDEVKQLFDEKEIELMVGTFPNLAGALLVYPFSAHEPPLPQRVDNERRVYLEYSLPDNEAERCVIWGNPLHDHRLVLEPVVKCLIEFPTRLSQLFGIPKQP